MDFWDQCMMNKWLCKTTLLTTKTISKNYAQINMKLNIERLMFQLCLQTPTNPGSVPSSLCSEFWSNLHSLSVSWPEEGIFLPLESKFKKYYLFRFWNRTGLQPTLKFSPWWGDWGQFVHNLLLSVPFYNIIRYGCNAGVPMKWWRCRLMPWSWCFQGWSGYDIVNKMFI